MHALLPEQTVYRRRTQVQSGDWQSLSQRRRMGALMMAAVAVAVLSFRRLDYDSLLVLVIEMAACTLLLALASLGSRKVAIDRPLPPIVVLLVAGAISLPWLIDRLARGWGFGNGTEIVMLSSLAWGGVAAAVTGRQSRTIGLSVVCSGFLTLFTTFISDSALATLFTYGWGGLCSWWLVTNHWERVEACAASRVKVALTQRIVTIVGGCAVFALTAALFANRIPVLRQIAMEVMPTSGGTSQHDAAARSGVGNGDAIIAARNHASSFGAVETNLFLDSDQPSLFDVFSDEFGEPMRKQRHEQAQALSPDEIQSDEGSFAEANRSSGNDSFSTQRETPRKKRAPIHDLASEALMYWAGQPGVRLAVERYQLFDGIDWKKAKEDSIGKTPTLVEVDDRSWFQPTGVPVQNSLSPFVGTVPEALKFTRYREPTIPTRPGMQLWSIDQLTRIDFFSIDANHCLRMPGREHVPDYTVVRFINSQIDLERMERLLESCAPGKSHSALSEQCTTRIADWAHRLTGNKPRGWEQVSAIVDGVRESCKLERSQQYSKYASSLEGFLEERAGPAYMFATATALMLEHVGYKARLVTGFYANPRHRFGRDNEVAVLPSDAHVWVEVNVGHGHWVPLEPTPGFDRPRYAASLWYHLVKARKAIALGVMAMLGIVGGVYFLRRWLFEFVCYASWPMVSIFSDRARVAWLTRILDVRLSLAGQPRSRGTIPRQQFCQLSALLPDRLQHSLQSFLTESDRLWFGGESRMSRDGREAVQQLWCQLTIGKLRRRNSPQLIKNESA